MFIASHPLGELPQLGAHRYSFYTLAWLSGADAVFFCDSMRFEVSAGSLVFITPGQVHWWESALSRANISLLGFLPEVFTGKLLDIGLITELPFFRVDGITVLPVPSDVQVIFDGLFKQAAKRYSQMATQDQNKTFLTLPRRAEGLLLAYLHTILAEAATIELSSDAITLSLAQSADVRLARLFRLHAETLVTMRHPVAYYANLLHVTPDHLTRVVRRVIGKPPSSWLQERLLLEARRLLTFTDQPIEHIAETLNFPTPTQFSQWFRTQAGQTPRDVRRSRI